MNWLLRNATRSDTAIVCGQDYTFANIARALRVPARENIGVLCQNPANYVAALFATWRASSVFVPLCTFQPLTPAPLHSPAEIEFFVRDANIQSVVVEPHLRSRLPPGIQSLVPGQSTDANLNDAHQPFDKDPAMIVYTSGTTGKPKGVVLSHANIAASIETLTDAWRWTASDRILHVLPLHHVHVNLIDTLTDRASSTYCRFSHNKKALFCPLHVGAVCEFHSPHADGIWERFLNPRNPISVFMAVPTIYAKLFDAFKSYPKDKRDAITARTRKFRLMVSGSAALPRNQWEQWSDTFGVQLLERYGMTETGMILGNPYDGPRIPGTVGLPFKNVKVQLAADEDDSQKGEILVKSPQIFQEYWNRPDATKSAFTQDGWFKTGDYAQITENGYYRILGRLSTDIIKSSGYKISSIEIESVVGKHVKECSVFGIPDPIYGEKIVCAIVGNEKDVDLAELQRKLAREVAKYKIPRLFFFLPSLPRNHLGKVNKPALKSNLINTI